MKPRHFRRAIIAVVVATWFVVAAEPPTAAKLAQSLGSPNYREREAAARDLWKMGEKARPALEAVLRGENVEAAERARAILEKFSWGIMPGTPQETLDAIASFRSGNYNEQLALVKDWSKDPKYLPLLRIVLAKDFARDPEDPASDTQAGAFAHLHAELKKTVPEWIRRGRLDEAEEMLKLTLNCKQNHGFVDYAFLVTARGHGKAAADGLRKVPALPARDPALFYLDRMNGDLAAAAKGLETISETEGETPAGAGLRERFLVDSGEWTKLAEMDSANANSPLGLQAFRHRLAGRPKEADEALAAALEAPPSARTGFTIDEHAMALLLNGRTDDGIARLQRHGSAPNILADLLVARLDFAGARALIDAGLKEKTDEENIDGGTSAAVAKQKRVLYMLKRGRLFSQLGQRDAAAQVFAALNAEVDSKIAFQVTQAVKAEVRSGFHDLASELTGRYQQFLDTQEDNYRRREYGSQDPYETLFDGEGDAARFWWALMRKEKPDEDPAARMRAVRDLIVGRMKKEEITQKIKAASAVAAPNPRSLDGYRRAVGLAAAHRALGQREEAVAALAVVADAYDKLGSEGLEPFPDLGPRSWVYGIDERFRLWIDLGDLLMALGKPGEAAKRYEQGWKRHPDNPIPLWLAGTAMEKAGDAAEGAKLREASHLVSLSDPRPRGRFLEELLARAAPHSDLRRARDDARRTVWILQQYSGNVWNQIGRAGLALKDYPCAIEGEHLAVYSVLRSPGVAFVEGSAYSNVPTTLISLEARKNLAEGKIEEAITGAKTALRAVPTHSETVLAMVPELDRLGKKAEAEDLFRFAWKPLAKLCADHPESAWARYQAAWIAAGCRRELDTAKAFAAKAVEVEPTNRSYREALAEVLFRLGDRKEAGELAEALAKEDPRSSYYQRLVERYAKAALDSALPDGADD